MNTNHTIFVSSTFKDMHAERDIIHEKVIPELYSDFDGNSFDIDFVDLRWGINTENINDENSSAKKILQVCFDEIERSQPFFICLIGNRYGWLPSEESVKSACMNAGIDHNNYIGKSITEIEVEYAMSQFPKHDNCYFFFRSGIKREDISDLNIRNIYFPDDNEDAEKIKLLKERIRTQYPERCFDYSCRWDDSANTIVGLDNLADLIIDEISGVLNLEKSDNQKQMDVYEKESVAQEAYLKNILSNCVERTEYLDKIINDFVMIDIEQKEMMLIGESGYGKSTLLATLGQNLRKYENVFVINLFSGITVESLDFHFVVRYLYNLIAKKFGYDTFGEDFSNIKQQLYTLLSEVSKQKKIVIIIDAINQLNRCAELDNLDWISSFLIPQNVRIVYSTLPETFRYAISNRNIKEVHLNKLNKFEIKEIACSVANRKHKQ